MLPLLLMNKSKYFPFLLWLSSKLPKLQEKRNNNLNRKYCLLVSLFYHDNVKLETAQIWEIENQRWKGHDSVVFTILYSLKWIRNFAKDDSEASKCNQCIKIISVNNDIFWFSPSHSHKGSEAANVRGNKSWLHNTMHHLRSASCSTTFIKSKQ